MSKKSRRKNNHTVPTPLPAFPTPLKSSLAVAVSSVLAGVPVAHAQEQEAASDAEAGPLEEIIVTAHKRTQNIQDIPASITAITGEDLQRGNLYLLEDYSRFVPSMSYFGNQSGSGKIFFRGIADAPDTFIAPSSAAIYLDEQPLTASAQVDIRMVDIERVEALAGPQGTLFGAHSQSGTLRIITNKPDPTAFDANIDVALKTGSDADDSYDISGMVNIPTKSEKFALRLVGYTATEGGFIDNVQGTTPICDSDLARCDINGARSNASAVENDWNETEINGGRIAGRWFINDNWTLTGTIVGQETKVSAENTFDATVGDLQLIAFSPDTFEDEWTQFGLVIEADLGWANFISATSYFDRTSTYVQDTTSYASYFGSFCYAGTATYNIYCFQPAGVNYAYNDPTGFLTNTTWQDRTTQEFRLSNATEKVDWVAGFFWQEEYEDWDFFTFTEDYATSQGMYNWINYWQVPATPSDAWWFSGDRTEWETYAIFGDVTFNFNEQWSATVGGRWFDRTMEKTYWVELPAGRLTPALTDKHGCTFAQAQAAPGGMCNPNDSTDPNDDGFSHPSSDENEFAGKLAVRWAPTPDKMVYALYSEGFRPGGTNRGRGLPFFPQQFDADFLTNIEIGAKTQWADGRLQVNLTAFFMDWEDYQLEVIDPSNIGCGQPGAAPAPTCGQPWQKVVTNAGDAESDGIELGILAAPAEGLELSFNSTWQTAETTDPIPALGLGAGQDLPFAADFKSAFSAQYSWPTQLFNSNSAYVNLLWSYVGDTVNQVQPIALPMSPLTDFGQNAPQVTQDSYDVADLKIGLVGDTWEFSIFGKNLGDTRGQVYHDNTDFEWFWVGPGVGAGRNRTAVIRPREFGVRYIKRWGQ